MERRKEIENKINNINHLIAEIDGKSTKNYNIGDALTIRFRDLTVTLAKVGYNIYEIMNEGDSVKIKKGDLIRIIDKDAILKPGEKISFEIFKKSMDYQTDPIEKVI